MCELSVDDIPGTGRIDSRRKCGRPQALHPVFMFQKRCCCTDFGNRHLPTVQIQIHEIQCRVRLTISLQNHCRIHHADSRLLRKSCFHKFLHQLYHHIAFPECSRSASHTIGDTYMIMPIFHRKQRKVISTDTRSLFFFRSNPG